MSSIGPLDVPTGNPPVRWPSAVRKLHKGWPPLVLTPSPVPAMKDTKISSKKRKRSEETIDNSRLDCKRAKVANREVAKKRNVKK